MTLAVPPESADALESLLDLLRADPRAPVSARSTERAQQVHLDDSLSGLEIEQLGAAGRIADLGSGAGLPGLVIAICRPRARVDLIESVSRKCDFLRRAIERTGAGNASVLCERAESWSRRDGREAYDAVAARAVGRLATVAELASPLLAPDGVLVAWKGARDAEEEEELGRAAERLAVEPVEVRAVTPYPGSRDRHIHVLRKNGPTPEQLPRRNGLAAKRPFGAE